MFYYPSITRLSDVRGRHYYLLTSEELREEDGLTDDTSESGRQLGQGKNVCVGGRKEGGEGV